MKFNFKFFGLVFLHILLNTIVVKAQIMFNRVPLFEENVRGFIVAMAQDHKGYMWFAGTSLYRYDGYHLVTYKNDPQNPNSISPSRLESICIDKKGIIWIGTFGSGLERYDPATGIFTHFHFNSKNPNSISNNIVTAIIEDRDGTLWVGTHGGLNRLDQNTGKFTRFQKNINDENSLSNDQVRVIYEDRQGTIWVGCGSPFSNETPPGEGGLNRLDKLTGKFTRYLHDPNNDQTLIDNKVRAICEDSRGTFWVGTFGDGLHTMDREKGTFKRFVSEPTHPEKLSTPLINGNYYGVNFIQEDKAGNIWIGSFFGGINRYDSKTGKVDHYEASKDDPQSLEENSVWSATASRDGMIWISTQTNVYRVEPVATKIEHIQTGGLVRAFLEETPAILWIGSDSTLIRIDKKSGTQQYFVHDSKRPGTISSDIIISIYQDRKRSIWIGTGSGLNLLNKHNNTFIRFQHDPKNPGSISGKIVTSILEDHQGNFWVGTDESLELMDRHTGTFKHYRNNPNDSNSISQNAVYSLKEDRSGNLWIGTWNGGGVNFLDKKTAKFKHYLPGNNIFTIYQDADGIIWAGTEFGLYRYNNQADNFYLYTDVASEIATANIVSILEDDKKNLWIGSQSGIFKINSRRNETSVYGKKYGVATGSTFDLAGYKTSEGEMLFGNATGYYKLFPGSLTVNSIPPQVTITDFKIADISIQPGHRPLTSQIEQTNEIRLSYKQNAFSFDFAGIHYKSPEENRHLYMLEGYEKNWRKAGSEKTAYYFNVPPGEYTFRVKASSSEGLWSEKSLKITITPPWWRRWWAYVIFSLIIAGVIWGIVYYRSRSLVKEKRLLEQQVNIRTKEISKQNKEISIQKDNLEKALIELRSTQNQLVQHEKMASLGVLTAGIAHEIKNPLNFVNNFAEVSVELLKEMEEHLEKGEIKESKLIAEDIKQNLEKITHHGQLADAIVKGMQQHARRSTGKKDWTNINSLTEEYLWICYKRLKEKEPTFYATIKTDFDGSLSDEEKNISVIKEDVGIVLLNIIGNSFYAVTEKRRKSGEDYEPVVSISTKYIPGTEGGSEIKIWDNGVGIPANFVNRVFQPFFTTKPAGKGTGLGLSLSYDIVKGHGGSLTVDTEENVFTEFIIYLPKQN